MTNFATHLGESLRLCFIIMDFHTWMSITMAMLGVILAAVICWQVYVSIDMRQYRKDFAKLRLDIEIEKQAQCNALREFAAETRLLGAVYANTLTKTASPLLWFR
ncbi:MAG: hypothetical protein HFJ83_03170 [Muribaculaceae bacterium]|jgi:hypothetical protein|nr:hypothetical protein [Muribaculaceae bacterium]